MLGVPPPQRSDRRLSPRTELGTFRLRHLARKHLALLPKLPAVKVPFSGPPITRFDLSRRRELRGSLKLRAGTGNLTVALVLAQPATVLRRLLLVLPILLVLLFSTFAVSTPFLSCLWYLPLYPINSPLCQCLYFYRLH